jgi:arylsulfatase A-like enzyme
MKNTVQGLAPAVLLLAQAGMGGILPASAEENKKPNIVVFIADDAGMDYGCYGNQGIKTPNIDALAESGLKVEKAFLTAPQSSPSRTSMLSGKFAHTIGTEDLHTGIGDTTKLLPLYLQEAGYYTGIMLKGHIGQHGMEQFNWYDQGFWPDYVKGRWNEKAVDNFRAFIDTAAREPFFLWVGFVDPHRAYQDSLNGAPEVHSAKDVTVPPYLVDNQLTREDLAHYYDEIHRMDGHIGGMIKVLEEKGLRENTLVVFLSDNGMPFPRAKGTVYDAGVQTPLIFSWKGKIKPGTVYEDELVSTIDLAPTFLDVAGVEIPPDMYGHSIQEIFTKLEAPGRDHVFSERNWHGTDEHIRSVRTKTHRFVLNSYIEVPHGTPSDLSTSPSWYALKALQENKQLSPGQATLFECPRPRVEIYDLEKDPYQLENVADNPEYLGIGKELSKVLDEWREETNDHPYWERIKPDKVDRVTGFPIRKKNPAYIQ